MGPEMNEMRRDIETAMTTSEGDVAGTRAREEAAPVITQRQSEVLRLSCEGLRLQEIADRLGVSRRTVEHHKYRMMAQLNMRTTAQLVLYAARRGWV